MHEVLGSNSLLIIGRGAEVHANYIKQAKYWPHVAVSTAYAKLQEASAKSGSILTPA